MSEEQVASGEAATYDAAAVQEKWQPVWEELQPFRADDDVVRSGTREKRYALTMFPYPSRRPAHGSRRGVRAARRDRALLVAARATRC